MNTNVTAVEKSGNSYLVTGKNENGEQNWEAEAVINSAGRPPAIFDLDLEKANIAFSRKGIEVNEYLQSNTNPKIYAAGDAANTEGIPLTPVAVMEGHIVASNIIKGNTKKPNYTGIPTVVFTLPTMASVGLSEERATEQGINFTVKKKQFRIGLQAKELMRKPMRIKP